MDYLDPHYTSALIGIAERCRGGSKPAYSYQGLINSGMPPGEIANLDGGGPVLIVAPAPLHPKKLAKAGRFVNWSQLGPALVGIAGDCGIYDRAHSLELLGDNLAFSSTQVVEDYFRERIFPVWFGDHTPYFLTRHV